jgi:hypothetical protein
LPGIYACLDSPCNKGACRINKPPGSRIEAKRTLHAPRGGENVLSTLRVEEFGLTLPLAEREKYTLPLAEREEYTFC